jgi:hypothetical protein
MTRIISLSLVLVGALASVPVSAQEQIRLKLEIFRNGNEIAAPTIGVVDRQTGAVTVENASLSFTPHRIDPDKVAVSFEIAADGKILTPRITLRGQELGTLSWKVASDLFEIRVAAIR